MNKMLTIALFATTISGTAFAEKCIPEIIDEDTICIVKISSPCRDTTHLGYNAVRFGYIEKIHQIWTTPNCDIREVTKESTGYGVYWNTDYFDRESLMSQCNNRRAEYRQLLCD
ncbi:MAG: hypothetical protein CL677_06345 [Bdellovibrionaceae bacterium]|nr:hypothetical protein [Pseudobdellovibrionaceae bacterium]